MNGVQHAAMQLGIGDATATVITALLGFLGGLFSSFGLFWWQGRVRRQSLRRALHRELEIPAAVFERAARADPDSLGEQFHAEIPTVVFESQADDIGLLSRDEIDPLVTYYSTARVAREQLRSLDDDRVAEQFLEETVPVLRRSRQRAVEEIESRV